MRAWMLAGLCLLTGCGTGSHDLWAMVHGDVTVSMEGQVSGVLVWEFFEPQWEAQQSADHHRCGRVLAVTGAPEPGCTDCAVAVTLETEDVEHDCPGGEGTHSSLAAMDRLQLVRAKETPPGAWPDDRWSWALGWSDSVPAVEGVAWDEGMEFGEPPADRSSLLGRRVRLMPTRARGLDQRDIADEGTSSE